MVTDCFPHRYQRPSKHVSDIAKRRRFEESERGDTAVREMLDEATDTSDEVVGDLESVLQTVWKGGQIGEAGLGAPAVRQQAETYETVRDLLGVAPSPWSELESAGETFRAERPDSSTTD